MATKFDNVRNEVMAQVRAILDKMDYEVLITGTQELCVPIVGEENEEGFLVLTFKVPKGSRDGDPYDGYAVAEEFQMKQKAKAEKAEASAKKKAEKIKRDEEIRRKKAEAKANREKA